MGDSDFIDGGGGDVLGGESVDFDVVVGGGGCCCICDWCIRRIDDRYCNGLSDDCMGNGDFIGRDGVSLASETTGADGDKGSDG